MRSLVAIVALGLVTSSAWARDGSPTLIASAIVAMDAGEERVAVGTADGSVWVSLYGGPFLQLLEGVERGVGGNEALLRVENDLAELDEGVDDFTSDDEEVDVAITVEVAGRRRAAPVGVPRQVRRGDVDEREPAVVAKEDLAGGAEDQNVEIAVRVHVEGQVARGHEPG